MRDNYDLWKDIRFIMLEWHLSTLYCRKASIIIIVGVTIRFGFLVRFCLWFSRSYTVCERSRLERDIVGGHTTGSKCNVIENIV